MFDIDYSLIGTHPEVKSFDSYLPKLMSDIKKTSVYAESEFQLLKNAGAHFYGIGEDQYSSVFELIDMIEAREQDLAFV